MNAKIKWLRDKLTSLKIDGMIITNPINIRYLTGLSEEGILIIAPKENIFVTDSRYIESVNGKLTIDDEIVAYDSRNLDKYDYENIFSTSENVGFEETYVTYENYKKYLQFWRSIKRWWIVLSFFAFSYVLIDIALFYLIELM